MIRLSVFWLFASTATFAASEAPPALTIEHAPVTGCAPGTMVTVKARVTPAPREPLFGPFVYVRWEAGGNFVRVPMQLDADPGTYSASLPPAHASFAYYLEAFDAKGHGPFRSGSPHEPFEVKVQALSAPAPQVATPLPPSTPGPSGRRTSAYVALGVGVAAVATGATFGVLALGSFNEQKRLVPTGGAPFEEAKAAAKRQALLADIFYGVGLVGLGSGAYLFWTSGERTPVSWQLRAGPSALALSGTF